MTWKEYETDLDKAGVSEEGQWSKTEVGTPQGSVLTPRTPKITSVLSGC
jgi:hypothetical protein